MSQEDDLETATDNKSLDNSTDRQVRRKVNPNNNNIDKDAAAVATDAVEKDPDTVTNAAALPHQNKDGGTEGDAEKDSPSSSQEDPAPAKAIPTNNTVDSGEKGDGNTTKNREINNTKNGDKNIEEGKAKEKESAKTTTKAATKKGTPQKKSPVKKKKSKKHKKKSAIPKPPPSAFAIRKEKAERNQKARKLEEERRAQSKLENTKELILTNQCKLDGIPNWNQIHRFVSTEQHAEEYIIDQGIVYVATHCPKCSKSLGPPLNGKLRCRRCHSGSGDDDQKKEYCKSIYVDSFFGFFRIKKADILIFLYHWLTGAKVRQLSIITGWSTQTLVMYSRAVQELVGTTLVEYDDRTLLDAATNRWSLATIHRAYKDYRTTQRDIPIDNRSIGGKNIQVQIAAMQFGKRVYMPQKEKFGSTDSTSNDNDDSNKNTNEKDKNNKTSPWLFCALEVSPMHKFVCLVVSDRNPVTLATLMAQYIAPESIVRWDYGPNWATVSDVLDIQKGYDYLYHPHATQEQLLQAVNQEQPVPAETAAAMLSLNDQQNWNSIWGENEGPSIPIPNAPPNHSNDASNDDNKNSLKKNGKRKSNSKKDNNESNQKSAPVLQTIQLAVGKSVFVGTKRTADTPQRRYNNVPEIQGCLFEFIWRMKHKANLWKGLLQTLTDVHYNARSGPLRDTKICVK